MQSFCQTPLGRGLGSPLWTSNGRFQKQHSMGQTQWTITRAKAERSSDASSESSVDDKKEKIYLGKGRFILDNPDKYPKKDNAWGVLTGICGGWAGGEVALREFAEGRKEISIQETSDMEPSETESTKGVKAKFMGREVQATKVGSGNDTLYIGWKIGYFAANLQHSFRQYCKGLLRQMSQEDLQAKKSGNMGNFIIDDAKKYPSKESFGVLGGLTGGWAGGEKGVKQYVEKGDITFTDPSIRGSQWSPVVVATIVAGVGSIGAILLTDVFDISEDLLKSDVLNVALDDNTKLLLEAAIGFLVLAWIGSAGFALFKTLRERLFSGAEGASKLVVGAGFWLLVLVVAFQISQS